MGFDLAAVRAEFPLLERQVAGRPIAYLDSAATALKPRPVIEAVTRYMTHSTANIHRGRHLLSQEASSAFEDARERVARWLGGVSRGVIFVRGATEAINLVAAGLRLGPGDNVIGSRLEHHSNILPWSMRAEYRAAPLDADGRPDLAAAEARIDANTRLIAISACSNVTGAVVELAPWVALARRHGLRVLVDAAQSGAHGPLALDALGADYVALSGHKMCGPSGAGVLYGQPEALEALDPPSLGGGTVAMVRPDFSYVLRELPWRLEAGTPDIAAVIGLGAAVGWLEAIGRDAIAARLEELRLALDDALADVEGIERFGARTGLRAPIEPFVETSGTFPADFLTRMLSDSFGLMLRAGHHCAHPLHDALGVAGTARASLHIYNGEDELERLADALRSIVRMTR